MHYNIIIVHILPYKTPVNTNKSPRTRAPVDKSKPQVIVFVSCVRYSYISRYLFYYYYHNCLFSSLSFFFLFYACVRLQLLSVFFFSPTFFYFIVQQQNSRYLLILINSMCVKLHVPTITRVRFRIFQITLIHARRYCDTHKCHTYDSSTFIVCYNNIIIITHARTVQTIIVIGIICLLNKRIYVSNMFINFNKLSP